MRILQVVASVDPSIGGPIEGVLQTSRWSTSVGNGLELATFDDPVDPLVSAFPFPVHAMGPVSSTFGYTKGLLPWLENGAGMEDTQKNSMRAATRPCFYKHFEASATSKALDELLLKCSTQLEPKA